ncbi:Uncharacterized protein FWK35_00034874 [Aphis craccivora]|uniref:MULE domain-containing protein n=1 Tax=Aphis craccivora TaxID=307492 RepID=A0A6G0Y0V4_APHCR|nr:Uncharacterized protein FWK35_00034874 [Aphis craccivora]
MLNSILTIVADFEQAIHFAAKKVWPSIILYKNTDFEIGKWLHLIFSLSLFPHYEVEDFFINELMTIQIQIRKNY